LKFYVFLAVSSMSFFQFSLPQNPFAPDLKSAIQRKEKEMKREKKERKRKKRERNEEGRRNCTLVK